MKIKIVQFGDGTYALRKYSFFRLNAGYIDLKNTRFTWGKGDEYFRDCLTDDFEHIKAIYYNLTMPEKIIEVPRINN